MWQSPSPYGSCGSYRDSFLLIQRNLRDLVTFSQNLILVSGSSHSPSFSSFNVSSQWPNFGDAWFSLSLSVIWLGRESTLPNIMRCWSSLRAGTSSTVPFTSNISNRVVSDDRINKWKMINISNSDEISSSVLVQEGMESNVTTDK